jgi:hypothetical protein
MMANLALSPTRKYFGFGEKTITLFSTVVALSAASFFTRRVRRASPGSGR